MIYLGCLGVFEGGKSWSFEYHMHTLPTSLLGLSTAFLVFFLLLKRTFFDDDIFGWFAGSSYKSEWVKLNEKHINREYLKFLSNKNRYGKTEQPLYLLGALIIDTRHKKLIKGVNLDLDHFEELYMLSNGNCIIFRMNRNWKHHLIMLNQTHVTAKLVKLSHWHWRTCCFAH